MAKTSLKVYKDMFARTFDFKGKSNLLEYWYAVLFNVLFGFLSAFLISIIFIYDFEVFYRVAISVSSLYEVVTFLPMLSLTCRRLHDTGKTSLSLLWALIPFVGTVILIVYLASPSQKGRSIFTIFEDVNEIQTDKFNDEKNKEFYDDKKIFNTQIDKSENIETQNQTIKDDSHQNDKQETITFDESKVEIADIVLSRGEQIEKLQEMRDKGEITDEEYRSKVLEILKK